MKKISAKTALSVCHDIEISQEAKQYLTNELTPAEFIELLVNKQLYADSIRFLARALPKREAIWWACLATRSFLNSQTTPAQQEALLAAETWVYQPTEENRRKTNLAAQASNFDNPAAWAAMAAFWSGGSMAPESAPEVPAAENLTAKAVAGAVLLAVVQNELERLTEKYRFFIQQAVLIASGGNGEVWRK